MLVGVPTWYLLLRYLDMHEETNSQRELSSLLDVSIEMIYLAKAPDLSIGMIKDETKSLRSSRFWLE